MAGAEKDRHKMENTYVNMILTALNWRNSKDCWMLFVASVYFIFQQKKILFDFKCVKY